MNNLKLLLLSVYGEFIKVLCRFKLIKPTFGINKKPRNNKKIIVSLTSYGRRVTKVLPFTIVSLLRQTYKPDIILLWLDNDNWNSTNIPKKLKALERKGLMIKFCKDIKSYKKLIPTLTLFPNDIIITCDDDIYYRRNMIERLVNAYEKDPSHIYAHRAHNITFTEEGKLKSYNDWMQEVSNQTSRRIFPTSGGGSLYSKNLLYKDVCKEDLFMKLAPNADDVWFYFMELLKGTTCSVLPNKGYIYIPLDAFYQHFHRNSNLYSYNCLESQNDTQIRKVMEYYKLTDANILGITKFNQKA